MNAWLPGISRRQYKFLLNFFEEYPGEWPGYMRPYREVLEKARGFRITFWVALCFCWSGVGALIFFISWMNHHDFVTSNRADGIPDLQKVHKLIKKELKKPSAAYEPDTELVQGELVLASNSSI